MAGHSTSLVLFLVACLISEAVTLAAVKKANGQNRNRVHRSRQLRVLPTTDAAADNGSAPALHFLFMLGTGFQLTDLWAKFFASAPTGSYSIWAHCSEEGACTEPELQKQIPGVHLVPTVKSSYCSDVVSPMAQLAKHATTGTASLGGGGKFIFLSGSTLPWKPFSVIRGTLTKDDRSDFCFSKHTEWGKARINNETWAVVKNNQWSILNRAHAQKFGEEWEAPKYNSYAGNNVQWRVPIRSDAQAWRTDFSPRYCTDAEAVFATIFGAVAGSAMEDGHFSKPIDDVTLDNGGRFDYSALKGHQGRCWTFAHFGVRGQGDDEVHVSDEVPEAVWIAPSEASHPYTFVSMTGKSLQYLRQSPFLFGRKFSPDFAQPFYPSIVFADGD